MKKIISTLCFIAISASSALAGQLNCTNLDNQENIKRSVLCSPDLHCVLKVDMENSQSHNILLNKMVSATKATITLASSQQKDLQVILSHKPGILLYARVSLNGIPVAACK